MNRTRKQFGTASKLASISKRAAQLASELDQIRKDEQVLDVLTSSQDDKLGEIAFDLSEAIHHELDAIAKRTLGEHFSTVLTKQGERK